MTTQTLQVEKSYKDELSRQGYSINQWIGFDDHFIPMYAHLDVGDKKAGDIAFKTRIGDPRTLNSGEANYIAHKASQGFFTWKPGADCLARTFRDFTFRKRPGGGTERIESEPYRGCQWCRKQETTSPTPEPAVIAVTAGIPPLAVSEPQAPALPSYDVLHCRSCPEVFVGESASTDRRMHEMRHKSKASTARRKSRSVPAEGSAKES